MSFKFNWLALKYEQEDDYIGFPFIIYFIGLKLINSSVNILFTLKHFKSLHLIGVSIQLL